MYRHVQGSCIAGQGLHCVGASDWLNSFNAGTCATTVDVANNVQQDDVFSIRSVESLGGWESNYSSCGSVAMAASTCCPSVVTDSRSTSKESSTPMAPQFGESTKLSSDKLQAGGAFPAKAEQYLCNSGTRAMGATEDVPLMGTFELFDQFNGGFCPQSLGTASDRRQENATFTVPMYHSSNSLGTPPEPQH
jgi:hypothetical protein